MSAQAVAQTDYNWKNPSNGFWGSPLFWEPVGVPGNAPGLDRVTIGWDVPLTINLNTSRHLRELSIPNPDALLIVHDGYDLVVEDGVTGDGTIELSRGSLSLSPGMTIDTTIRLVPDHSTSLNHSEIVGDPAGGAPVILAPGNLVYGSGYLRGAIVNHGTVRADVLGRAIVAATTDPFVSDGVLEATNGAVLSFPDGLIGGVVRGSDGGLLRSGSSGLRGVEFEGSLVVSNWSVTLGPGNVYNGSLLLMPASSSVSSRLYVLDQVSVGGRVVGGGTLDAFLFGPAAVDEIAWIGLGATVTGPLTLQGNIANRGTVEAVGGGTIIDVGDAFVSEGRVIVRETGWVRLVSDLVGGVLSCDEFGEFYSQSGHFVRNAHIEGVLTVPAGRLNLGLGNTYDVEIRLESAGLAVEGGAVLGPGVNVHMGRGGGSGWLIGLSDDQGNPALVHASTTVSGEGDLRGSWKVDGVFRVGNPGDTLAVLTDSPIHLTGKIHVGDQAVLRAFGGIQGGIIEGEGSAQVFSSAGDLVDVVLDGSFAYLGSSPMHLGPGCTLSGELSVGRVAGSSEYKVTIDEGATIPGTVTFMAPRDRPQRAYLFAPNPGGFWPILGPTTVVRGSGRMQGGFNDVRGLLTPGLDSEIFGTIQFRSMSFMNLKDDLAIELDLGPNGDSDLVDATGVVELGGEVRIRLAKDFVPTFGQEWTFLEADEIAGDFRRVVQPERDDPRGIFRLLVPDDRVVLARYECVADHDGDGGVTPADVSKYVADFIVGGIRADVSAPYGTLNFFDIAKFLAAYHAGCE